MNPDDHVYCVDCKFYHDIWTLETTPEVCRLFCFPFDPEDSAPFSIRLKYQKKQDDENGLVFQE